MHTITLSTLNTYSHTKAATQQQLTRYFAHRVPLNATAYTQPLRTTGVAISFNRAPSSDRAQLDVIMQVKNATEQSQATSYS
jgi:hypothetical protein